MNSIIILFSYHHKNTEKVAQVIAKAIGAEIKAPLQIDPNNLVSYDLVGFGSGVYFGKLGKDLLVLADKIPRYWQEGVHFFYQRQGRKSWL